MRPLNLNKKSVYHHYGSNHFTSVRENEINLLQKLTAQNCSRGCPKLPNTAGNKTTIRDYGTRAQHGYKVLRENRRAAQLQIKATQLDLNVTKRQSRKTCTAFFFCSTGRFCVTIACSQNAANKFYFKNSALQGRQQHEKGKSKHGAVFLSAFFVSLWSSDAMVHGTQPVDADSLVNASLLNHSLIERYWCTVSFLATFVQSNGECALTKGHHASASVGGHPLMHVTSPAWSRLHRRVCLVLQLPPGNGATAMPLCYSRNESAAWNGSLTGCLKTSVGIEIEPPLARTVDRAELCFPGWFYLWVLRVLGQCSFDVFAPNAQTEDIWFI